MNWILVTIPWMFGLVGVAVSLVSLRLALRKDSREQLHKLIDEHVASILTPILARMVAVETKIEVFWKGVSYSTSQVLHSPHTPELDVLIEKFQCDDINDDELGQFKLMLWEIIEDESRTPLQRKSASDVLTLIKIRYEMPTLGTEI